MVDIVTEDDKLFFFFFFSIWFQLDISPPLLAPFDFISSYCSATNKTPTFSFNFAIEKKNQIKLPRAVYVRSEAAAVGCIRHDDDLATEISIVTTQKRLYLSRAVYYTFAHHSIFTVCV